MVLWYGGQSRVRCNRGSWVRGAKGCRPVQRRAFFFPPPYAGLATLFPSLYKINFCYYLHLGVGLFEPNAPQGQKI